MFLFMYCHFCPLESASRLQVILNEIQPRDTNDYFNQAKILKECDSFDLEDLNTSVSNINTFTDIKGNMYRINTTILFFSRGESRAQDLEYARPALYCLATALVPSV